MQNLDLIWQFSAPTWLVLLLALVAIIAATLYYRQTNPIVSRPLQITLTFLRAAALLLLLLVIYEWTLGWQYYHKDPPLIAVAIDNSASMSVTDLQGARPTKIDSVVEFLYQNSWNDLEPRYYTFGNTVEPLSGPQDSLHFKQDGTNISAALQELYTLHAQENLNGIILITDGNYNQGNNPVRTAAELGVPVYPMGIGSTESMPDLSISDVQFNAFAYVGEETPVKISISNRGFTQQTRQLELVTGDSVLVTKPIRFTSSPSDQSVDIPLILDKPGRQKIVARLDAFDNEITATNNQQTFYINVLKSRINILFIAGLPSPDISFIRNAIQNIERYQVSVIVQQPNGQFFDPDQSLQNLNEIDMFLLYGYPNPQSNDMIFQQIKRLIELQPTAFFIHPNSDTQKLNTIPALPAAPLSLPSSPINIYAAPTPMGRTHPILFLEEQNDSRVPDWLELPPVFLSHPGIQPKSDAMVLLGGKSSDNHPQEHPLIIVREEKNKSLLVTAHDLWRWKLLLTDKDIPSPFNNLLGNMIRWLETEQTDDLVRFETMQDQFQFGERITARIAVNNPNFQPVDSALVICELSRNGKVLEEKLASPQGNGTYTFQSIPEQPGDYTLRAVASIQGQQLGTASSLLTVGQYNKEYTEVRLQKALLQTLAMETNGAYIDSLTGFSSLEGKNRFRLIKKEREIWNLGWTLFVIIAILSVEWFIRKQKGML